jgi:uncharacterized membrane protein YeaQ/YmgE (transglycosylase-associated protein family)
MIGMAFGPFVGLLVLGAIAAIVIHYAIGYRVLARFDGFMVKWIAGWIGGWLGSAVYGHWGYNIENVYIIPALLGAFTLAFLAAASVKASAMANATTTPERAATAFELRKAS